MSKHLVVNKYMASDDLNDCVDALLRKEKEGKSELSGIKMVIKHNTLGKKRENHLRQRKGEEQHKLLAAEYEKNPIWDKETISRLSVEIGLKES